MAVAGPRLPVRTPPARLEARRRLESRLCVHHRVGEPIWFSKCSTSSTGTGTHWRRRKAAEQPWSSDVRGGGRDRRLTGSSSALHPRWKPGEAGAAAETGTPATPGARGKGQSQRAHHRRPSAWAGCLHPRRPRSTASGAAAAGLAGSGGSAPGPAGCAGRPPWAATGVPVRPGPQRRCRHAWPPSSAAAIAAQAPPCARAAHRRVHLSQHRMEAVTPQLTALGGTGITFQNSPSHDPRHPPRRCSGESACAPPEHWPG